MTCLKKSFVFIVFLPSHIYIIVSINAHMELLLVLNEINPVLQDPSNRNIVNCDDKLKTVLLGRSKVELSELPMLVKLHFPKFPKS